MIIETELYLHLHTYHIMSLRGEVWAHKTSLTSPLFMYLPVPNQKSERSCIVVLGVSNLPPLTIGLLDFRTVPTV